MEIRANKVPKPLEYFPSSVVSSIRVFNTTIAHLQLNSAKEKQQEFTCISATN